VLETLPGVTLCNRACPVSVACPKGNRPGLPTIFAQQVLCIPLVDFMLTIYNSLTRGKEVFKPIDAGKVRMYV